jgi:hypothetical protein
MFCKEPPNYGLYSMLYKPLYANYTPTPVESQQITTRTAKMMPLIQIKTPVSRPASVKHYAAEAALRTGALRSLHRVPPIISYSEESSP